MCRFLSASVLASLLLLASHQPARAEDDDPSFQGKKLSEWLAMLSGEKSRADRQTALAALGAPASHPGVWQWQLRTREAGLLAVTLVGPQKSNQVLPALLAAMRADPDEAIRRGAALSLGRLMARARSDARDGRGKPIPPDEVRSGLATALRGDKSGKVREACAKALGMMKEDAAAVTSVLAAALRDDYSDTQAAAAEALRVLGVNARDALPELQQAVRDPKRNTMARVQATLALGILKKEAEIDVGGLLEVLEDDKAPDDLRVVVAETLGTIGKSEAVPALARVLARKDPNDASKPGVRVEVRQACVAALDAFGPAAKPALPALRAALDDKDKFVRTLAMHAVGRIGKDLGADGKEVVKALLKITGDPVIEVRVAAIETLGNLGPEALGDDLQTVLDRLAGFANDAQRAVRDAAADARKKLKPA